MIGYAFSGSFCTLSDSLSALEKLISLGEDVLPIISKTAFSVDTRFFLSEDFVARVRSLTGKEPIHTIEEAEPLGPKIPLEALIIAPCTGNTLAKMANGITDTSVTMAAKAHLRCDRPLLIALASNDAMSQNLSNVGRLITRKSIYFVPMIQDDPKRKPHSLVADFTLIPECLTKMRQGENLLPMFRSSKRQG